MRSLALTSSVRPGQQAWVDFVFFLLWFAALRVCSPLGLFFRAAGVPRSAIFLIASSMADPEKFS